MSKPSTKQIAEVIVQKRLNPGQIASYLVQQRRTRDLSSIMREVARIRAEHGVVEAEVVSAHGLSAATEQAVTRLLLNQHQGAKKVILDKTLNPEVTGGVRITSGGIELDSSVHGRLNRLRQTRLERT